MFKVVSEEVEVLRVNSPATFKGKDGNEYLACSIMLKDGIYPVKVYCTPDVLQDVQEGEYYQFELNISFYQNKTRIKAVRVL